MNSKQAVDQRNRYFRHRHLTADDYSLEQVYGIARRRLLSQVIVGWGVARGYAMAVAENGELMCGSGLALDRHGRELVRRVDAPLGTGELVRLDANGQPAPVRDEEIGQPQTYLLQAHYAERLQGAVRAGNICDCGKQEFNFALETVLFSLRPMPDGWIATAQAACADCGCGAVNREVPDTTNRRPHACLCAWTQGPLPAVADTVEWNGDVCYRLADAVPLALVTVAFDHCRKPTFSELDACTPRRIVKTNDMLFDLIRGCDLTTITEVSWAGWHDTEVEWETFRDFFPPAVDARPRDPTRVGNTRFTLTFSRPVQVSTLRASCVSFKVFSGEAAGGWLDVKHIPVTGLDAGDVVDGCTSRAFVQVRTLWCNDEIWGGQSDFDRPTRIDVAICGDLILDCNGQAVDATPAGPDHLPSGNGTPGGTYFSSFQLTQRTLS